MRPELAAWRRDCAGVALAVLLVLVFQASGGFSALGNLQGDNDSLLRLVQIRDLMAGQAWFDPQQYRMGSEGGFTMHWSRFVDAPVAAIMIVTGSVGGAAAGETAALIAWPLMTYALSLVCLVFAVRRFAGGDAVFPAVVIGGVNIYMLGIFLPAALDHHNIQLALTLAVIAGLLAAPAQRAAAPLAGTCAALMMAVGAETLPYVAAGGLAAALLFLIGGERERATAAGFGLAFAFVSALAFAATVPPVNWFQVACDSFSAAQLSIAVLGGTGLALASAVPAVRRSFTGRFAALGLVAVCTGGLMLAVFPQCLADPYAGLDPRLRTYWLSAVTEAQSLASILAKDPVMAASYYATPLLAAGLIAVRVWHAGWSRPLAIVALFLGAAILVSVWQVRGAMFSISIAAIPLAAWVAGWRKRVRGSERAMASVRLCLVWLLSFSLTWDLAIGGAANLFGSTPAEIDPAAACYAEKDYAALAALPPQTVLAVSNLGAPILKMTPHRTLAGPYHRNDVGNLLAQSMFFAEADEARELLRRNSVTLVVHCSGNPESRLFNGWAPSGLLATLSSGHVPDWLDPVPDSGPLQVFHVIGSGE